VPVRVERFDGHLSGPEPDTVFETTGVWESRVAYPVTEAPEPQSASLAEWAATGGWLPAGPEGGGADAIGKVLAECSDAPLPTSGRYVDATASPGARW
jgi:hypothetical protein